MNKVFITILVLFVACLVPQLASAVSYSPAGVTYTDNTTNPENAGRTYTTNGSELMRSEIDGNIRWKLIQSPTGVTILDSIGVDYHLTSVSYYGPAYVWGDAPQPKPADRCATADINDSFYAIDTTGMPCWRKPVRGMKKYIRTGKKPKGYHCKHRGKKSYTCKRKGRGRSDNTTTTITGIIDPVPPSATASRRIAWCGQFSAYSGARFVYATDRALCPIIENSMGFYTYAHAYNFYGSAPLSLISGYGCSLQSDRIDCNVGNECVVMSATPETHINPNIGVDMDEREEYYYTDTPLCT